MAGGEGEGGGGTATGATVVEALASAGTTTVAAGDAAGLAGGVAEPAGEVGTPRTSVGATAGVGDAATGIVSRTDVCFCLMMAREMLVIMNTAASAVVTRESKVAEPRGPKAA